MNCTAFKFNPTTPFVLDKHAQFIPATRIRNPHRNVYSSVGFSFTRKKLKRCRHLAPPNATSLVELELPLLPFPLNEVLVPSESKALHLYEARYLALLEESLTRKKLFVHFVLDPIIIDNSSGEASFAARNGCLVFIENVERLEVGALVSIRGIGRVKIVKFVQADPYLKGVVIPEHDRVPEGESALDPKVMQVKEALYSLNSLEIKLKAPKEAPLQTRIANSLMWSEKELVLDCDEAFIPSLPERVSFAALQPVSGSGESELAKLQLEKLRAMELKDTVQRLDNSLEFVKDNISMVAAKLAIQSVEMQ
ncbi:uncharacterized protein LOC103952546 [Pyrus x bretschneideri]|uniref:uncharacterized protein LOC103952546 n=1 Tax=Pyrus x bretschneideri TaxID=225117 RepID=UPI00202F93FF|nr:uncharacterized protein LOC103952546 [Pyrus x bretschneideri]